MAALGAASVPRALAPPAPALSVNGHVHISHPRNPRGIPLLSFPSFQSPDGGSQGVPVGVVLDACTILAGNRPGQLRRLESPDAVFADTTADPDAFIHKGSYLFIVFDENGAQDDDYAICRSFREWEVPAVIPQRWKGPTAHKRRNNAPTGSSVSQAVRQDDKRCIVTSADEGLESAYLVPRAEKDWFNDNYLLIEHHGGQPGDLNSIYNEVALRADLNARGIDSGVFLFTPYAGKVVTIFTSTSTIASELAYEYQLRLANITERILWLYLFIRFAFNTFFVSAAGRTALENHLKKLDEDDEEQLDEDQEEPDEDMPPPDKKRKLSGGGRGYNRLAPRPLQPYSREFREALLVLDKAADAALPDELTLADVQAGRYRGYSKIRELALQWHLQNPQISAVGGEADVDVTEEVDDLVDAWARGDGVREAEIVRKETHERPAICLSPLAIDTLTDSPNVLCVALTICVALSIRVSDIWKLPTDGASHVYTTPDPAMLQVLR
ncbi:hypothetical protein C8J57DRAFT_1577771 [Mycena rebaudengoi]|nr:hypothetical protein C8J57DRAFT_1577771 [Mycena rebaudengoi]